MTGWPKPDDQPFVAWPGWKNLRGNLILAGTFFCIFYGVYGFTNWITALHTWRLPLYFTFELAIPFWPGWAIIYLSINGMFLLSPFVFRTWRELWPLFMTVVVQTFIAGFFFIILPMESGFPAIEATGWAVPFFNLADTVNLDYNYFPSLHVTFALTIALGLSKRCHLGCQILLISWALAIASSTILTHEHHLLDILGGIGLAIFGIKVIYPRHITSYPQVMHICG